MADRLQSYASHRRYIPEFHFFALPVLAANAVLTLWEFARHPAFASAWIALVAVALVIGIWTSRAMALRAQDRIIRLEERQRLDRLLPPGLRERAGKLTTSQLIALRFAADDEVEELAQKVIAGELNTRADIKRAIHNWRPDDLRV
jgi:hypothetical protein